MMVPKIGNIRETVKKYRTQFVACLVFSGLIIAWLALYPVLMESQSLDGLNRLVAGLTAYLLHLMGNEITVSGAFVSSPLFSMEVGNECTGIVPAVLLLCGVLAYPSPLMKKFICVLYGIPIIFLVNLVRTASLYYIGVYLPGYFEVAHFVVWQSITILVVIAIWIVWISRVVNAPK